MEILLKYTVSVVGISLAKVHEILTKLLNVRKVCARKIARKLLKIYKNCDRIKFVDLLTGDETWNLLFWAAKKIEQYDEGKKE